MLPDRGLASKLDNIWELGKSRSVIFVLLHEAKPPGMMLHDYYASLPASVKTRIGTAKSLSVEHSRVNGLVNMGMSYADIIDGLETHRSLQGLVRAAKDQPAIDRVSVFEKIVRLLELLPDDQLGDLASLIESRRSGIK